MSKAYEVMTKSLAIVDPDDNIADVVKIMKDRDIGNVLVAKDGKLMGIATDRDLALSAIVDAEDAYSTPISKYMSTDLITGDINWSLNKIADTMAQHQVRRLPILDHGEVVGIISLGDVARYHNRKDVVTDSLKEISTPNGISAFRKHSGLGSWLGLSLMALTAIGYAWMTWSHTGKEFKKTVMKSKPYYSAAQAMNVAMDKVNEAATSKTADNIRKQVKSNLRELSSQLPTIQYKPAKHRRVFFG